MTNFIKWFNNIADMPVRDEKGNWYDLETGIAFNNVVKGSIKPIKTETEQRYGHLKLADLKETVTRFVKSQKISIERNNNLDTSANQIVINTYENLTGRITKSMLLEIIDMNSKASRTLNKQINK